jgi:hypothetical protein
VLQSSRAGPSCVLAPLVAATEIVSGAAILAGAPVDRDAQPKGHARCSSSPMIVGSSSLKDLAARGSMLAGASLAPPGPVHPLAALPAVAQRAGARSSPHAAYSRVRPHLALRTLLL